MSRAQLLFGLEQAQLRGCGVGVVYLDLDRFHQVNARWGQRVGDRLLEALGDRLAGQLPPDALLAAIEGDAFLVVLPDADFTRTKALAQSLLESVRKSVMIDAFTVSVGASAGFAFDRSVDHAVDLVEQSFLACRRAKATVPGTAVGYEVAIGVDHVRKQRMEDGLLRAIGEHELRLYVQPTVDLRDGRVMGVEALIRWQHPLDGLLMPGEFLPVAEAAGLMVAIGDWVLDEAIALAMRWRSSGRPMRVWVNLAAQQLADGDRLCARVRAALAEQRIDPADLGFEVTESSLLEDLPSAVGVLTSLRQLGVEIALDDFGTGYSSLSYLRQLPVTAVKIDRSFVGGIGGSLADEAIVEAVIDLAHALGLRVVAEGIEEIAQADALISMGADEAQGFLFGRPGPPEMHEQNIRRAWCGTAAPRASTGLVVDPRAAELPGFGSPRARLLLAALDTAHDSILVTAAAGIGAGGPPIVYVNAAFEAETGYRSSDVVGRTADVLFPDEPNPDIAKWFQQVHNEGRAATTEVVNRRADGSTFLCELTLSPIVDERGAHTHWLHVRRDLTQRRAVEGDRARFQGLIEQSASLVVLAESGGAWVYANAAQRAALGMDVDESLDGVTISTVYSPQQLEQLFVEVLPSLQRDGRWSGPAIYTNRVTGEITEVISDIQVLNDPLRPGVKVYASVSRDVGAINAMERAETRRRELGSFAAQLAQRALDLGHDELLEGINTVLASFGQLLRGDLAYLDMVDLDEGLLRPLGGWTSDRYPNRTMPPSEIDLARLARWIERLSSAGVLIGVHMDIETNPWARELSQIFEGQPIGSNMYAPLRVGGVLIGVLGLGSIDEDHEWTGDEVDTMQQVADTLANFLSRQRSDRALRASEAYLTATLGNVRDILVVVDNEGWIKSINAPIAEVSGLAPSEVIGRHFLDLIHPDDHAISVEVFTLALAGSQELPVVEVRLIHVDGSSAWFDVDSTGTFDETVGGFVVALRNVSSQRAHQAAVDRRLELEHVLLGVSHWAIEADSEEILDGLDVHLEQLSRVLGSDAAFASLLDDDQLRVVARWQGDAATMPYLQPWKSVSTPAIAERLRTLKPIVVEDLRAVDEAWGAEWQSLPGTDRSILGAPLMSGGRCLGVLGVAMTAGPRTWMSDEIALVLRVSETVAAVLARQRVEASLRMSEIRLGALLNGSQDLVVVVGDDGTLLYANAAAERRLGYSQEAWIGRSVTEFIHPDDLPMAVERLTTLLTDQPTISTTVRLVARDGSIGWWEISAGVARDPIAGGRVLTARDVTEQLALERDNMTRVEHLRYAFDVAQAALDLDAQEFLEHLPQVCADVAVMLAADFVYVDQLDENRQVLVNVAGFITNGAVQGVGSGQSLPFASVPMWIERLRNTDPIVVCDPLACCEPWLEEKRRVLGPEGAMIAVAMSAAGELFGVLGVSMCEVGREWSENELMFLRIIAETIAHVLERSRVDEALRASEARFRLLSETAADLVLLFDGEGKVVYASPSSVDLVGFKPHELVGRSTAELVHPDDFGELIRLSRRSTRNGQFNSEVRLLKADGTYVWVANSTSTVVDPDTGRALEFRASVRDITDRKRLEAELERQALHDPLTGLGNRILLQSRLDVAAGGRAVSGNITVLLVDLDGFKAVNDTYGHAIGDEVLRVIAARLRSLTRPNDTLARTGGDEFVLLCPDTNGVAAIAIGERIVRAVNEPLVTNGITIHLGASVGAAHQAGPGADPDWLLIEADHAMYAAKRGGRNCVRLADTSGHPAPVASALS